MNCKPGDLAIIVRSEAGNEGKIVRCIRFFGNHTWRSKSGRREVLPTWEIDIEITGWSGKKSNITPDEGLRPIRDPGDDARDETLDWLPVPTTEKEKQCSTY